MSPPGTEADPSEEPIRITPGANDKVEEIVIDGRRILRVTTPAGAVYFLRDDLGARHEDTGDRLRRAAVGAKSARATEPSTTTRSRTARSGVGLDGVPASAGVGSAIGRPTASVRAAAPRSRPRSP